MASVFFSFLLSPDVVVKMLAAGLGMSEERGRRRWA